MHTVALFGSGKIGEAITGLLGSSGKYKVLVCDIDGRRAKDVAKMWKNAEGRELDIENGREMLKILKGCRAVLNALPFYCNVKVAEAAAAADIHYFDLTEDVSTSKAVAELATKTKKAWFMPQCGLAPGFISIAAAHLVKTYDEVDTVKMRVGALPIFPSNRLKYNLTWSTDGLINEYCNLCEIIDEGKRIQALPLEGYETFSLDGDEYEAFNTSGGLGTLSDTLEGKVRQLDYKSVRYPGHREYLTFLMQDLRFNSDRETLKRVFERSIPATPQDKCLIFTSVTGKSKGRLMQRTYASTVYDTIINKHHFSAIQITTASGICTPLDLALTGKIKKKPGFLRSEDISLTDFLKNQFGKYYHDEKALKGISF